MGRTDKAWNYVFNTVTEDHNVAKVLATSTLAAVSGSMTYGASTS